MQTNWNNTVFFDLRPSLISWQFNAITTTVNLLNSQPFNNCPYKRLCIAILQSLPLLRQLEEWYKNKRPRPSELDHSDQDKHQNSILTLTEESQKSLDISAGQHNAACALVIEWFFLVRFFLSSLSTTSLRPCTGPRQRSAPRPFLSPQTGGTLLLHPVRG